MTAARTAVVVVLASALAFAGGWLLRSSPPAPRGPSAVDVGFCQDMAVHHAQATLMAQLALDSGTPAVRAIARQILITQSEERGTLTGWLTTWRRPQLPSGPPMSWMPGHHHAMPGLATQPELDRLADARGQAFDTRFVRLMLRHHAGGIQMATAARERARLPEVRALAGAMVIHQTEENAVLRQLLNR